MIPELPGLLAAALERLQPPPRRCLLVGPTAAALRRLLAGRLSGATVDACEAGALPVAAARYPLAAVLALEALDAHTAEEALSRLRDVLAEHVLVHVRLPGSPLAADGLRALGFRQLARAGDAALFGFDLYDYKDRPEWLTPEHWAHPERWDKHRW